MTLVSFDKKRNYTYRYKYRYASARIFQMNYRSRTYRVKEVVNSRRGAIDRELTGDRKTTCLQLFDPSFLPLFFLISLLRPESRE